MIFQHTWQWIIDKSPWTQKPKTLTTRIVDLSKHWAELDVNDRFSDTPGIHGVYEYVNGARDKSRVKWIYGKRYAVQPGRNKAGVAFIEIEHMWLTQSPFTMTPAQIRMEGFDTLERFTEVWHEMHGKAHNNRRCFKIQFKLVQGV